MMRFTVSVSCGKLSPFCEARDALILYIFDDETDQCLPLIDPYTVRLRTPEYVNSADSVPDNWTKTGSDTLLVSLRWCDMLTDPGSVYHTLFS